MICHAVDAESLRIGEAGVAAFDGTGSARQKEASRALDKRTWNVRMSVLRDNEIGKFGFEVRIPGFRNILRLVQRERLEEKIRLLGLPIE
jgi:hypothetical protein